MRLSLLVVLSALVLAAQTKPILAPADYGKFETLVTPADGGGLSPDGKWLAYGINRSNRDNELRVTNIATGATKVAAFGSDPVFSRDSKWVAYGIGVSEAQEKKLKKDKKPVQKKLGLMNLATQEQTSVDGVESFTFSPNGVYLAFVRYAPEKPEKKDKPEMVDPLEDEPKPGATLIIRQLDTGRETSFGNVASFAWQELPSEGRLLAMTINAEDKTGNGVQLFDPQTGSLRVLDSGPLVYDGLAWRKKSSDLAVLKAKTDEDHEGAGQVVMSWTQLNQPSESAHIYDPAKDATFPEGMRIVSYRKPEWSDDGTQVFMGIAKWDRKPPKPNDQKTKDTAKEEDEQPAVEVWHWRDLEVQPKQKLSAKFNRQKNMLGAWNLQDNRFVQLGRDLTEQVSPLKHQGTAYVADWTPYAMDRSIGRPAADLYLQDEKTGDRIKIQDKILNDRLVQPSPGGLILSSSSRTTIGL